jgi:hypothetical protein
MARRKRGHDRLDQISKEPDGVAHEKLVGAVVDVGSSARSDSSGSAEAASPKGISSTHATVDPF